MHPVCYHVCNVKNIFLSCLDTPQAILTKTHQQTLNDVMVISYLHYCYTLGDVILVNPFHSEPTAASLFLRTELN